MIGVGAHHRHLASLVIYGNHVKIDVSAWAMQVVTVKQFQIHVPGYQQEL